MISSARVSKQSAPLTPSARVWARRENASRFTRDSWRRLRGDL